MLQGKRYKVALAGRPAASGLRRPAWASKDWPDGRRKIFFLCMKKILFSHKKTILFLQERDLLLAQEEDLFLLQKIKTN